MKKQLASGGIIGIGVYIPDEVRTNEYWDNIKIANLPNDKAMKFEGIESRRVFPEDLLPSDIEAIAGENAIKDSGLSKDDIDLVLVHSMLQDELVPGNASLVQHKLGLKNAGAWNIDTCCSSFVTMITLASNLIAMKEFKNILIVTSVIHSKLMDYSDYLSPYAGDGAGAVIVGQVPDNRGYIASSCNSHGYYHDAFTVKERMPHNDKIRVHYKQSPSLPLMTTNFKKMREVGRSSVEDMKIICELALEKAEVKGPDIDLFLSHQPCHWAHDAWREAIDVREGKSHQTFTKYGNMASACIPINLYEAREEGKLKDGDNVLITSSGAGVNHIAAVLKWHC
ncbi:ketoacyl-ACP synthase III [Clostridiaceae bacterium M8S5]|nr:ketoacyl-ACP synthase III [Clostridiaceae bacterium M8S5]